MHLCWTGNWVFRSKNKSWTNYPTNAYFGKKIKNFSKKIKDRKQLERFLECLSYASDFINDLAKLRKPLQHKLKKEVSWTCTTTNSKINQKFKKMCTNLPVLNLHKEGDNLILEIDVSNEHWSIVFKIKEGEKLYKYYSGGLIKQNATIPRWKKKSLQL